MTYTFKLARRLAVSREYPMLAAVVLLAGCTGETTAPDAGPAIEPTTSVGIRVLPSAVTIETGQPIRFRGEPRTGRGRPAPVPVSWEASGGVIDAEGNFSASTAGTYRIVGRGRGRGRGHNKPDTSIVVVVPPQPDVVAVAVIPDAITLSAATTHAFRAVGILSEGDTVEIGVTWRATGGTIDAGGLYTADAVPGSYRVIGTRTDGVLADTAAVTIAEAPAPPPPAPTLVEVVLTPASASLPAGGTRQFAAYGRNSVGDSVSVSVTFAATGGTITSAGRYTAGTVAGTYRAVATGSGLADTATIEIAPPPPPPSEGPGVPFGVFNVAPSGLDAPLNLTVIAGSPDYLLSHLAQARKDGTRVIVNFAGGKYSNNYGADGHFSYDIWKARVDGFKGLDLAPYIADGTLFANYLIDEPHHAASWGGEAVPYETLERMARYSKSLWPTLTTIIRTRVSWLNQASFDWVYLDAGWAQYAVVKGDIGAYRNAEVAASKASGLAVLFGLNTTNGGAVVSGCTPGTRVGQCSMSAAELKRYGTILAGEAMGCGLTLWQHDAVYLGRSDIRAALAEVAGVIAAHPTRACR